MRAIAGYIKVADNMFDHHKFVDISAHAALLHVHAMQWSHSHDTDGAIPAGAVQIIARRWGWPDGDRLAESLVLAGVWELADEGYQVHNYDTWQQTSDDRLALSQARSEAGRRGGFASAAKRKEAQAKPSKPAKSKQVANQTASRGEERRGDTPSVEGVQGKAAPPRRQKRSKLPAAFGLTPERKAKATERGLNPVREFEKFASHHRAKGSMMLDWDQAWRYWCSRAEEYAEAKTVANGARRDAMDSTVAAQHERIRRAEAMRDD